MTISGPIYKLNELVYNQSNNSYGIIKGGVLHNDEYIGMYVLRMIPEKHNFYGGKCDTYLYEVELTKASKLAKALYG